MTAGAVVITGAAGDLGRALTRSFLDQGRRVHGADLKPCPVAGVIDHRLDVTERDAVFALARRVAAEDGLAAWVNAAGLLAMTPVREASEADWQRLLAVNLSGTWHGCAAALESMIAAGSGGVIVNLGSLSGQLGYPGLHPAYGASKAAVHQLTKTYALEGARHGVRVNAVAPSVLEGSMGDAFSNDQRARLIRANPLGRLGTMEDAVGAIAFLCSPQAAYITGATLPVNGGSFMP
ncbi:SDR family NAD(P)-dependent oxidoreductase [Roseospirillum parvum]|uniref:Acetoacetyl-CoA reductase/3-oxoacyl-[acyl-carrier protein] reductase/meso-butanediol dehydrogenase / (S,S)-butanediol dehydrogenase / diacetyl reductase n=1 Tax=Roseospirillum parvum TaxID=83401 RepID=A0A1G7UQV5_9PROT|nr:SDR family NAD(P)-dependent oxidoreductase [Roseospirillum parvum]SDG49932.1 acetoacetyl-CoA reductase/3-oxoacyl-[acyl-carrier protein] reductase/meso-butanediol dehydrogenase / (S,S)-butanediol dehydrogenase / diacetyl reductase [Roseospirillum parvum]